MSFSWICQVPNEGWWANYRWHITKKSEELILRPNDWKKSFFRSGWQGKVLEVDDVDNARKCLQALQNSIIVVFGGRFRGASYDKNAKLLVKQAKRSLKKAIKEHTEGKDVSVEEIFVVPTSYYNWGVLTFTIGIVIFVVVIVLFLVWKRVKKNQKLK